MYTAMISINVANMSHLASLTKIVKKSLFVFEQ